MREIDEADRGADLAHRRERGIGAYRERHMVVITALRGQRR